MTTISWFSFTPSVVKSKLLEDLTPKLDQLFEIAENGADERTLEKNVWLFLLEFGRLLLATLFALQSRRASEREIREKGLDLATTPWRLDQDYWNKSKTTLGTIDFPLFAYREKSATSTKTQVPARQLFPLHPYCRSSQLCLEWQTLLGSEHPFREAQKALNFFTHGAVSLEDTTIASHMVNVGLMVDRPWLYQTVQQIRETLENHATRCTKTGKPIIYASTDAHALRRYVDETWQSVWKMANGLRLWCIDKNTGELYHLGGEYTWGDCNEVERIVREATVSGLLPTDGDYGDGVVAQIVWVTDGMPWFEERILKLFPGAKVILDVQHAFKRLRGFATSVWTMGSKQSRRFLDRAKNALFGAKHRSSSKPKTRKGHKKSRRAEKFSAKLRRETSRKRKSTQDACLLFDLLSELKVPAGKEKEYEELINYMKKNAYRMDYGRYLKHGYQIGSGAMESLHRVASQLRIKRPGPGWLAETAQAVFNLRMLALVGRWDEFWNQPNITELLVTAFQNRSRGGAV